MNNRICAFITILVILAILLCSTYHIYLAFGLFTIGNYITGIVYSLLSCEILYMIFPMLKFYNCYKIL